jgi:hypothetical protein
MEWQMEWLVMGYSQQSGLLIMVSFACCSVNVAQEREDMMKVMCFFHEKKPCPRKGTRLVNRKIASLFVLFAQLGFGSEPVTKLITMGAAFDTTHVVEIGGMADFSITG